MGRAGVVAVLSQLASLWAGLLPLALSCNMFLTTTALCEFAYPGFAIYDPAPHAGHDAGGVRWRELVVAYRAAIATFFHYALAFLLAALLPTMAPGVHNSWYNLAALFVALAWSIPHIAALRFSSDQRRPAAAVFGFVFLLLLGLSSLPYVLHPDREKFYAKPMLAVELVTTSVTVLWVVVCLCRLCCVKKPPAAALVGEA